MSKLNSVMPDSWTVENVTESRPSHGVAATAERGAHHSDDAHCARYTIAPRALRLWRLRS